MPNLWQSSVASTGWRDRLDDVHAVATPLHHEVHVSARLDRAQVHRPSDGKIHRHSGPADRWNGVVAEIDLVTGGVDRVDHAGTLHIAGLRDLCGGAGRGTGAGLAHGRGRPMTHRGV